MGKGVPQWSKVRRRKSIKIGLPYSLHLDTRISKSSAWAPLSVAMIRASPAA